MQLSTAFEAMYLNPNVGTWHMWMQLKERITNTTKKFTLPNLNLHSTNIWANISYDPIWIVPLLHLSIVVLFYPCLQLNFRMRFICTVIKFFLVLLSALTTEQHKYLNAKNHYLMWQLSTLYTVQYVIKVSCDYF